MGTQRYYLYLRKESKKGEKIAIQNVEFKIQNERKKPERAIKEIKEIEEKEIKENKELKELNDADLKNIKLVKIIKIFKVFKIFSPRPPSLVFDFRGADFATTQSSEAGGGLKAAFAIRSPHSLPVFDFRGADFATTQSSEAGGGL